MFFADKIQSNGRIDFVYLLYGDVADEFIFLVVLVVDVVVLLADVAHILIILQFSMKPGILLLSGGFSNFETLLLQIFLMIFHFSLGIFAFWLETISTKDTFEQLLL